MGHDILKCTFCGDFVMEGHNEWFCDCGAICTEETDFIFVKYPACPKCGNNRQVWKNQLSGELTCHRVGCYTVIESNDK